MLKDRKYKIENIRCLATLADDPCSDIFDSEK